MKKNSPPTTSGNMEQPEYKVYDLKTDNSSEKTALLLKLTDECNAKLKEAAKKKWKIVMEITENKDIIFEICAPDSIKKFQCSLKDLGLGGEAQNMSSMDAVCFDHNGYQSISSITARLQVNATDQSFRETKEKAQKMQEEENKKKVKDLKDRKSDFSQKRSMPTVGRSNPVPKKPAVNARPSNALAQKVNGSSSTKGPTTKLPESATKTKTELGGKSFKSLITHLLAVGQYTIESLASKLDNSGPSTASKDFESMVHKIAYVDQATSFLVLKKSAINDLDVNYEGYNKNDREKVRKLKSDLTATGSFVPSRNQMQAPSSTVSPGLPDKTTISPKLQPTQVATPSPKEHSSYNEISIPLKEQTSVSTRKSHAIKRPLTSPKILQKSEDSINKKQKLHTNVGSFIDSLFDDQNEEPRRPEITPSASHDEELRRLSPMTSNSLTEPSLPSRDWNAEFKEIKSIQDAQNYHKMFSSDYDDYYKAFNTLRTVADEFSKLSNLYRNAIHKEDKERVEKEIQNKFSFYQKDHEFLLTRQRHADLRAKLEVLKKRVHDWEKRNRTIESSYNGSNGQNAQNQEEMLIF